jgi:MFS family permease
LRFSRLKPQASSPSQYALQLVQVFFVGLTLGMTRTVVPAVAESDFGVPRGDLALIATFVIAFGLVKGAMNFVAGALSETLGRKRVLVIGWIVALPIPWMIWYAPREGGWNWVVAATVLLGVNQGLTWSMTLTSKLDLTRSDQRGLTNGLNEFCGYFAVAVAGVITGYLSDWLGPRGGLLVFGLAVILPALLMAMMLVRETRIVASVTGEGQALKAPAVFLLSLRERTFFAICQAGLFEKFIDALMWIVLPLFQVQRGIDLRHIGWIPGIYTAVWGVSQIFTGPLSDRIGRKFPITLGMLLCAIGVGVLPLVGSLAWWSACAAVTGLGMAMLYPTLGAAVSDVAGPAWRGAALGVYRFWRDLGYAIGAAALALLAHLGYDLIACFWLVAGCVAASGIVMWIFARETRPPATQVLTP